MKGEIDLILMSEYKGLIEALDALYTIQKLTGRQMEEPYISFHDQAVNGKFGWNVFFNDVKIVLGIRSTIENKVVVTIRKVIDEEFITNVFGDGFNHIEVYTDLDNFKTVVTVGIDLNLNEEFIRKILRIIDLSFSV